MTIWIDLDDLADKSRVTLESEAIEDVACLTDTRESFEASSTMAGKVAWGWQRVLFSLKTFLETGKGLNIFCK